MPLLSLLAPLVSWIFRAIVVKFIVLVGMFALVDVVVPMLLKYVAPFVSGANLSLVFAGLPPGIWYFVDLFQLPFGLPLLISAYVARFLIRRIPIIG